MDLLLADEKILGGAIRRMGDTILYQGSLQLSDARPCAAAYEAVIRDALGAAWNLNWRTADIPAAVLEEARRLEARYRAPEWIRRR